MAKPESTKKQQSGGWEAKASRLLGFVRDTVTKPAEDVVGLGFSKENEYKVAPSELMLNYAVRRGIPNIVVETYNQADRVGKHAWAPFTGESPYTGEGGYEQFLMDTMMPLVEGGAAMTAVGTTQALRQGLDTNVASVFGTRGPGSSSTYGKALSDVEARIRQITYDRGLSRKALEDSNYTNPTAERELKKLRSERAELKRKISLYGEDAEISSVRYMKEDEGVGGGGDRIDKDAFIFKTGQGKEAHSYMNPTKKELKRLMEKSDGSFKYVRDEDGNFHVFSSMEATHVDLRQAYGISETAEFGILRLDENGVPMITNRRGSFLEKPEPFGQRPSAEVREFPQDSFVLRTMSDDELQNAKYQASITGRDDLMKPIVDEMHRRAIQGLTERGWLSANDPNSRIPTLTPDEVPVIGKDFKGVTNDRIRGIEAYLRDNPKLSKADKADAEAMLAKAKEDQAQQDAPVNDNSPKPGDLDLVAHVENADRALEGLRSTMDRIDGLVGGQVKSIMGGRNTKQLFLEFKKANPLLARNLEEGSLISSGQSRFEDALMRLEKNSRYSETAADNLEVHIVEAQQTLDDLIKDGLQGRATNRLESEIALYKWLLENLNE